MKIRGLLQACIVVAVGVGLVSCTKEEIDQAMNRPAEIILQSSPCTPAGVASTATPEFCVNVTELQLLRQDTQADVSLTLVNRTGRRQYITLTGADLTDRSGTKWAWTRNSGLGDSSNPLPLEPNVEAQGSITFSRTGQAPADLTFSLRGEFAILRVDSRGQPINQYPYVAKRGFNLSGIRIQQQPPQSSAPTEQNPDTKLAQVSPRSVAPATPKASVSAQSSAPGAVAGASGSGNPSSQKPALPNTRSTSGQMTNAIDTPAGDAVTGKSGSISVARSESGPDVIGFRIGMTPAEARAIFKSRALVSDFLQSRLNEKKAKLYFTPPGEIEKPVANGEFLQTMGVEASAPGKSNEITVVFSPVPGHEEIVSIYRSQNFLTNENPTFSTLEKAVVEKYGPPTYYYKGLPVMLYWSYDRDGTLRKPSTTSEKYGLCTTSLTLRNPDWVVRDGHQRRKAWAEQCGSTLLSMTIAVDGAVSAGPNSIVLSHITDLTGLDAALRALEASTAIVDKAYASANEERIQNAQKQKPKL